MSFIARTMIVAWCALFWISPSQAQDVYDELVVTDGTVRCAEWSEMLENQPGEAMVFTGMKDGMQIQLLVDPTNDAWRLISLTVTGERVIGCEVFKGTGFLVR